MRGPPAARQNCAAWEPACWPLARGADLVGRPHRGAAQDAAQHRPGHGGGLGGLQALQGLAQQHLQAAARGATVCPGDRHGARPRCVGASPRHLAAPSRPLAHDRRATHVGHHLAVPLQARQLGGGGPRAGGHVHLAGGPDGSHPACGARCHARMMPPCRERPLLLEQGALHGESRGVAERVSMARWCHSGFGKPVGMPWREPGLGAP